MISIFSFPDINYKVTIPEAYKLIIYEGNSL